MKTLRTTLLGATALIAGSSALWAADLGGPPLRRGSIKDAPAPYVEPVAFSWTGFYIGGHVGYAWSDVDWDDVISTHDGDGWVAGGQIGYNWQAGALVFGVEADMSGTGIEGATFDVDHEVNWLASVRGRLGVAVNANRTLLYGTAGVAWADIDHTDFGVRFSETHVGWVAGAGIEHMLSPKMSARVEYLYYGLEDVTAPSGFNVEPTVQTVRAGVNFKF